MPVQNSLWKTLGFPVVDFRQLSNAPFLKCALQNFQLLFYVLFARSLYA